MLAFVRRILHTVLGYGAYLIRRIRHAFNAAVAHDHEAHASGGHAEELALGIDCACYYTDNFFVGTPFERHFEYHGAEAFEREHEAWLANLGEEKRSELLGRLAAEAVRRRGAPKAATARKRRIKSEYTRVHPQLWSLREEYLHPEFVRMVRGGGSGPRKLADGTFALPVLSARFCELLCAELAAVRASGLPLGRPNSMNTDGVLLDELGLAEALIAPLVRDWLEPLCARLPSIAAAHSGLDHHKAFVVRYRLGEDEQLSPHFDNAEVTLNVNLGHAFSGGELAFEGAAGGPQLFHAWGEVGHGVLHLGRRVHAALPITDGERENLVVWMRSSAWRREHGCPMCGVHYNLLQ